MALEETLAAVFVVLSGAFWKRANFRPVRSHGFYVERSARPSARRARIALLRTHPPPHACPNKPAFSGVPTPIHINKRKTYAASAISPGGGGAARQTTAVIHRIHSGIEVFNINFHLEVVAAAALC